MRLVALAFIASVQALRLPPRLVETEAAAGGWTELREEELDLSGVQEGFEDAT